MTPLELRTYLDRLVAERVPLSTMLWGPPGIGKSSIVAQVAAAHRMDFVDVRLSQLAPTDLRGLPVPDGTTVRWLPPDFLPQSGAGILFLDELNLAPPAMQGIAQQLILDRKVGSYTVPRDWFVWAAGNRKEDRASVFDMPAPLANRFLHLSVAPDLESFRAYGLAAGVDERILAFLSFRPTLLHHPDPQQSAWPSPRTWEMAGRLLAADLAIAPAVGDGPAAEFDAYSAVYRSLPDLDAVLAGQGDAIAFPKEPSVRYATVIGLTARFQSPEQAAAALAWLHAGAGAEWLGLFAVDAFRLLRARGELGPLAAAIQKDPALARQIADSGRLGTL
jgi:hypothetical protein